LERSLENPTVVVLEQLAEALGAGIAEFFTVPTPGNLCRRRYGADGGRGVDAIAAVVPKIESRASAFRCTSNGGGLNGGRESPTRV